MYVDEKLVYGMDEFIKDAKAFIASLHNDVEGNEPLDKNDIYVVWSCKTLQNFKALLSAPGKVGYWEATFNGDKAEMYLDEYHKARNVKVDITC